MSLDCLLHLRWHQCGDCDLVSLHTLLPGTIIRRADKEHTTEHPGRSTREQNEYISGETQTARQSQLSVINNWAPACFAVLIQVEWQDRGSEDWYGGRCIILYGWRGGTAEYMRRHSSRAWKVLTEMNFEVGFIKTKLPIMGHYKKSGTFSKCGLLTLSIILSHSFSSMYISLYKLLDPWSSNVNIHNFLIYLKAHSKNELLFLHG